MHCNMFALLELEYQVKEESPSIINVKDIYIMRARFVINSNSSLLGVSKHYPLTVKDIDYEIRYI